MYVMFRVEYEVIPYLLTYLNFFLRFKDGITVLTVELSYSYYINTVSYINYRKAIDCSTSSILLFGIYCYCLIKAIY